METIDQNEHPDLILAFMHSPASFHAHQARYILERYLGSSDCIRIVQGTALGFPQGHISACQISDGIARLIIAGETAHQITALFHDALYAHWRSRWRRESIMPYSIGEKCSTSRLALYSRVKDLDTENCREVRLAQPRRVKLAACRGLGFQSEGVVLGGYLHLAHAGQDLIYGPMTLERSYALQRERKTPVLTPYAVHIHEILPHGVALALGQLCHALGMNAVMGPVLTRRYHRVRE